MKRSVRETGFALAITLVLMALIVIVILAYLTNTRIDRATSSIYADELRAQMIAESGLAAGVKLLHDTTKSGNYITAMPSPSPSPAFHFTEIYEPDPSTIPDDFLKLDNAIGNALASEVTGSLPAPTPQVDPRPIATPMPAPVAGGSFGIATPAFSASDSFDFNQVVRVGNNSNAHLVDPDGRPAFGQWIRIRNSSGELVGRYAFFIEDESMKVNVNQAGNNLGSPAGDSRPGDLIIPPPTSTPATQVDEIDPAGVLPTTASRVPATQELAGLGNAGSRIASNATLGLLPNWTANAKIEDYTHLTTEYSSCDETTARGWQRMNLNDIVASNSPNVAAQKISDWIRDAWTGPVPLSSLQPFQVFGDDRLRLQFAANIVDYIDSDNTPTDMGLDPTGYPIVGIEKIPYLVEVDVIYTATPQNPDVPGKANITMKFRFNFMNLFETDLKVGDFVKTLRIKGVPVINKNGDAIFDHSGDTYDVVVGAAAGFPDGTVPWGGDNVSYGVAGAKTFYTGEVLSEPVTYTPAGTITTFESGLLTVDVLDGNGKLLDSLKLSMRDLSARWDNSSSNSLSHDFLETRNAAASINATYGVVVGADGTVSTISFGDPRYRPPLVTGRMYNLTRTDTGRFTPTTISGDDKAELDSRSAAVDWYDYVGNRPLAFLRNLPMQSVGELGNVSLCEFPWRTLYLQYPGRPRNTTDLALGPEVENRRGSSTAAQTNPSLLPQDYVLMDLFRTTPQNTRTGKLNINTQFNIRNVSDAVDQGAFTSLYSGIPVGGDVPGDPNASNPVALSPAAAILMSTVAANRRVAVTPVPTGGPGAPGDPLPIYNNPRQPYFTIGQLAADVSWLINQSENTTTTGNSRSRSTVNYSILRQVPLTKTTWYRNYGSDMQVEEPYRKISDAITTRGNVFRVLYVGQSIKDANKDGAYETNEPIAEYLGEAIVERNAVFATPTVVGSSNVTKTSDSKFTILAQRAITQ